MMPVAEVGEGGRPITPGSGYSVWDLSGLPEGPIQTAFTVWSCGMRHWRSKRQHPLAQDCLSRLVP